jgi:hypothetical protein
VTNNALQKLKKELEEAQKKLSEYEKESKTRPSHFISKIKILRSQVSL